MNNFNFLQRTLSIVFVITLATFMACHKDHEQPAVSISSFTPPQGKAGDAITISGSNFSATANSNVVDFNGTNATVTSATTTSLVVTVPQGATTGKISVVFDKSKGASADNFTVLIPATITSFAPASGAVGTVVNITGTNFSTTAASNVVKFNGTAATVSAATATSLTVAVPTGATTGKITVVVNGTIATSSTDFAVSTTPAGQQPTLTGFSPANGLIGSSVTITGTNFSTTAANDVVKFNGTIATVISATTTSLIATVPANASTGTITVTVSGVLLTSTTSFTVTPQPAQTPVITSFSPITGSPGTTVTINGSNFDATAINNTVKFNGTATTVTAASTTSLTVVVPQGASTGTISVTVNGITGYSADNFTVTASGLRWRVKEMDTNGYKTTEFVYDNNNVLIQAKGYSQDHSDPNSVPIHNTDTYFFYNADGTLSSLKDGSSPNPSGVYKVDDYSYTNEVVQSDVYSNEINGVKTTSRTNTYTYQNGLLTSASYATVNADNTISTASINFTYATDNMGNPQTIYHYPSFINTYTFYLNVISPDPLDIVIPSNDKYIVKAQQNGANANFNYNVTYTINSDGNIEDVYYGYPNKPSYNYQVTYIYETY